MRQVNQTECITNEVVFDFLDLKQQLLLYLYQHSILREQQPASDFFCI